MVVAGCVEATSPTWTFPPAQPGSRVGDEPYPMGCDFGSTLTYTPTDTGMDLALTGCAFTPDLPLTGSGEIGDDEGSMTLDLRVPGGRLRYLRDGDGNLSVTGSYRGARVRLAEAA